MSWALGDPVIRDSIKQIDPKLVSTPSHHFTVQPYTASEQHGREWEVYQVWKKGGSCPTVNVDKHMIGCWDVGQSKQPENDEGGAKGPREESGYPRDCRVAGWGAPLKVPSMVAIPLMHHSEWYWFLQKCIMVMMELSLILDWTGLDQGRTLGDVWCKTMFLF